MLQYGEYMIERGYPFLNKAVESLIGAESEFSNKRYNNTANRAYCTHLDKPCSCR
jgi:hypothetical protein